MTPLEGARRLVVKIGSSILVDEARGEIRRDWLEALTDDVVGAYRTVRAELKAYGGNLVRKKEIVALNKTDAMTEEDIEAKRALLAKASRKSVYVISGVSGQGVQPLLHELLKLVEKQREPGSAKAGARAREAA